jgi:hypothetical protein
MTGFWKPTQKGRLFSKISPNQLERRSPNSRERIADDRISKQKRTALG